MSERALPKLAPSPCVGKENTFLVGSSMMGAHAQEKGPDVRQYSSEIKWFGLPCVWLTLLNLKLTFC